MNARALPETWAAIPLGEMRVDRGRACDPKAFPTERFTLFSVPAFPTGQPEVRPATSIGSTKRTVEPGTVLLCKINPHINRVWVVGAPQNFRQIASTEWISFFPVGGVVPGYLAWFMRRASFRGFLASNVSGVGGSLMRVNAAVLAEVEFPLPPLAEQARIVAALDQHLTRLDAAAEALRRVRAKLKTYRTSVLKAACEGRLVPTEAELARREGRGYETAAELLRRIGAAGAGTALDDVAALPEGWTWVRGSQIFPFVTSGSRNWARYYSEGGASFIRIGNLDRHDIRIDLADVQHVQPPQGAEGARTRLRTDDILISITADIGLVGLAPKKLGEAYINQHIALARPIPGVSASYIAWYLAGGGLGQLRELDRGAVKAGLGLDDIRSVVIPLPSLAEQHRIVAEVERRLSVVEKLEAVVETGLERAEKLRQAILKRAFEGKLVPQDPNDEPASVLLERIRAERAAAGQQRDGDGPRRRRGGQRGGTTRRTRSEARG